MKRPRVEDFDTPVSENNVLSTRPSFVYMIQRANNIRPVVDLGEALRLKSVIMVMRNVDTLMLSVEL